MTTDRLEDLRLRTYERDVTLEEVREFLTLEHTSDLMSRQDPANFIVAQDIKNFWWLYDWWAPIPDKPKKLSALSIIDQGWKINVVPNAPALTFDQALQQWYAAALKHCESIGLDPNNLGETAEDKQRRKNRERMAKTRMGIKVPDKRLADPVVSARVRELEDQRKQIELDGKVEEERLAAEVKEHQQLMIAASARRKEHVEAYKARMMDVGAEINALTAKQ